MARTPLMRMLKRATRRVASEAHASGDVTAYSGGGPITRRHVLLGGAAAGASFLFPFPLPASAAQAKIAIVGAGLAGLTAAHKLKKSFQLHADVYEGNTRVGGRCFTARGIFAQNQIAEHGGELIDTDHVEIRGLAHELGLKLTDVLEATPEQTRARYMFNGQPYNLALATRDWRPIYDLVQRQSKKIGNFSYKHSTQAAKESMP